MDPVPPPLVQPAPEVATSPELPKSKIWLWVLGGVLLLAVGTVGGIFLGKQIYSKPAPTLSPTPLPGVIVEPPFSPRPSNLKTYQNSEFSFKYPASWVLDTNGKKVSSSDPEITLWVFSSNDPMYNECMKLDSTKILGILLVKTFSRVTTAEACNGGDTTLREKWIVKSNGEGYAPGIQFIYKSSQQDEAEKTFDQILSTFRFLE